MGKKVLLKALTLEKRLEFVKFLLVYGSEPVIISEDLRGLSDEELLDNQLGVLENEARDIQFREKIEDYNSPVEWVESFEEHLRRYAATSDYRQYLNSAYKTFN